MDSVEAALIINHQRSIENDGNNQNNDHENNQVVPIYLLISFYAQLSNARDRPHHLPPPPVF